LHQVEVGLGVLDQNLDEQNQLQQDSIALYYNRNYKHTYHHSILIQVPKNNAAANAVASGFTRQNPANNQHGGGASTGQHA